MTGPLGVGLGVVDPPAVPPDLSARAGERGDGAHLEHGARELAQEVGVVPGVEPHQASGGGAARVEHLVGAEEAPRGEDVPEVGVVEPGGAGGVQREEVVVPAGARAPRPQLRGVGRVEREVRQPVARLVVQPLPEAGAPRHPDGVAPWPPQKHPSHAQSAMLRGVVHSISLSSSPRPLLADVF